MKKWLDNKNQRSYHVTYLNSHSQNEFIDLLDDVIRNTIVKEINESPFYTIMEDTTPDLSKKDQMLFVFRFVSNNYIIHGRLLRVMEDVNKTGVGIANGKHSEFIWYGHKKSFSLIVRLCFKYIRKSRRRSSKVE